jgi:hypothetical protein
MDKISQKYFVQIWKGGNAQEALAGRLENNKRGRPGLGLNLKIQRLEA